MARKAFDELETNELKRAMEPAVIRLYTHLFPGSRREKVDTTTTEGMVLDGELAVDVRLYLAGRQWLSVQEKVRKYEDYLEYGDFTQEYKNAAGTPYESDGEWFKLGAQLYLYGWANEARTDFVDWVLIDVAIYKLTIDKQGGIERVGRLRSNHRHGRANFYAIPLEAIKKAIILSAATPLPPNRSALPHVIEHLNGKPDSYTQKSLLGVQDAFH